jgi:hypothetical protein
MTETMIPDHSKDSDCTLDADGICIDCGVYHDVPCPECGGCGFHNDRCSEIGEPSEPLSTSR